MTRPNILIIYTDQQRWDALGCNGNMEIQTPRLDQLASEGTNFDCCIVQNPVCMPSRVSFLTGQYCSRLGITHMGVPVPEDTVVLPRMLSPYGYTCANIGKLHFLPHAARDHRLQHPDYGFDHLEISDEPGCYEDAYRAWVRRVAPDQLDHISVGLPPATELWHRAVGFKDGITHAEERFPKHPIPFPGRSEVTHTAFCATQTIDFLRQQQRRGGPFLCITGIYSPHSPWVAPQEFFDLYDPDALSVPTFPPEVDAKRDADRFSDEELRAAKHGYYGMVSEVDHHVGRMLDALDELGLQDDTIVVFISDHGEWLGEHLRYGKGHPAHDCISRVPLIIRWPEGGDAGEMVHDVVEAIDVVPTLLSCAGIQLPPHLQGRPLLGDAACSEPEDRQIGLTEFHGWKAMRTPRYRYLVHADGREWLFDLEKDPAAYHDVAPAAEYADTLTEMRQRLLRHLLDAERPLPKVWAY